MHRIVHQKAAVDGRPVTAPDAHGTAVTKKRIVGGASQRRPERHRRKRKRLMKRRTGHGRKHRRCHPHEKVYRHSTVVRRRRPIRGSGGARHRNCPSTSDTGQETATAAAGHWTGTGDTETLRQVHRHRRTATAAVIGEHRSLRTGAKT